ncbi:MAG TPA: energy-coupling factor transporter transmembrane component T [Acidimicrobiales bacterium]|nr:energy-coupling factor transporter transmembrane component T [Acidimicrobiales bacterium]
MSWALAAAAVVQLAPNPVYVTVVIAIAALVLEAHAKDAPLAGAFPVLLLAGVAFGALRVALTALTAHAGGAAIVHLPHLTLPTVLGGFTVGGSIETGVVVRAAADAWVIVGIVAVFGAFNGVVSHYELVQAAPRAFYEIGLAITVALAFVPSTLAAIGAVREADRARTGGRVIRRGRLLRQLVPILETGMERAVALAESMDSRGFGHRGASRSDAVSGWLGAGALLTIAAAFVALVARAAATASALLAIGAIALAAAITLASRGTRRVRYRSRRLSGRDWMLAGTAWIAPAGLALVGATHDASLDWPASVLGAPLGLPPVSVAALACVLALAIPMLPGMTRSGR